MYSLILQTSISVTTSSANAGLVFRVLTVTFGHLLYDYYPVDDPFFRILHLSLDIFYSLSVYHIQCIRQIFEDARSFSCADYHNLGRVDLDIRLIADHSSVPISAHMLHNWSV